MKKILLVIDMQNDFIAGSLGSEEAKEIVDRVCQKIRLWDGAVAATLDSHGEDYLDTAEGRMLPVRHCILGTEGWALETRVNEAVSSKPHYLGQIEKPTFGSRSLMDRLARDGYEYVELVGLCTDICVITNALLARTALPEAKIVVDARCCAGVTPERHQNALDAMQCCNIEIANREA